MTSPPASSSRSPRASRRTLLRLLATALLGAIAALWYALSRRRAALARPRSFRVPAPTVDGVFFHGPVIVTRDGESLRALSARCPHLGCLIGQLDGEQLVCACHGSRFGRDGRRLAGPAQTDLERLSLTREGGDDTLRISNER